MKSLPSRKTRIRVTITFDPDLHHRIKQACGMVPMSRQIEDLLKQWLETKEKK